MLLDVLNCPHLDTSLFSKDVSFAAKAENGIGRNLTSESSSPLAAFKLSGAASRLTLIDPEGNLVAC